MSAYNLDKQKLYDILVANIPHFIGISITDCQLFYIVFPELQKLEPFVFIRNSTAKSIYSLVKTRLKVWNVQYAEFRVIDSDGRVVSKQSKVNVKDGTQYLVEYKLKSFQKK